MKIERIPKLIIKAEDIQTRGFNLSYNNQLVLCDSCKSPLFYVKIVYGIVVDECEFQVMFNRDKRTYSLREIGFVLYCAECGDFKENYYKYFYPEDKLITDVGLVDDIDTDEIAEIQNCLYQWDQKGDFKSRYKSHTFINIKEKLKEYEKKHPVHNEHKQRLKRNKKKA